MALTSHMFTKFRVAGVAATLTIVVLLHFGPSALASEFDYIQNYEFDFFNEHTLEEILYGDEDQPQGAPRSSASESRRRKRQAQVSSLPQISFREMAAIVSEAEGAIKNRFDLLEPSIYDSDARQLPKSPEWFMSASAKIKILAKNISKVALVSEEATNYIAKKHNLTRDEITFGLPLADVRGTTLGEQCLIKVDYPCQPGKYRAYNGYCNNVQNPNWGVSNRRYLRYIQSDYADGISIPRQRTNGEFLPSPRSVSVAIHTDSFNEHPHLMVIAAIWGEFIYHDAAHTPQMAGYLGQRLKCCDVEFDHFHPECYPIKISTNDPFYGKFGVTCQEYARSATASRTGCTLGPREQINQVTSFIDGSTIYGSSKEEAESLRTFTLGQLKTQFNAHRDELLPPDQNSLDCQDSVGKKCFKSGDVRVNEHPGMVAIHTLWVRQHNQLATQLADLNPHWNDEQIFQETRRIVGAQIQHITFNEYLPTILGKETMDKYSLSPKKMGFYSGYDINTNPGTANSVATAAFRFTTSLLPAIFQYYEQSGSKVKVEKLSEAFYKPFSLYEPQMIDNILRGITKSHSQSEDIHVNGEMTNKMFMNATTGMGLDLVAQIIQQGRGHGLPGYVKWRSFCGLPEVTKFEQLKDIMTVGTIQVLKNTYSSIEDIDLFTGGLAEVPSKGAVVGPTFACLIGRQMFYYKSGDRYWYENDIPPSSFTKEQLNEIRKVSLARIICDNTKTIDFIQPNVFLESDPFLNALMPCSGNSVVQKMNLNGWTTASPRFIVPDNMLLDAIERAKRDVSVIKDREWNLFKSGNTADPKSPTGSSYGFMKPKVQSSEISNTSFVLQFASRRFLDNLLTGEDGERRNRQLQDAEFGNKGIGNLQELMDVLPNIDVSDVMDIPKVFQCDEQTLPCDHTTKYRTLTGWCNNLMFPEYGKSIRAFTRLLAPAYDDGLMSPRSRSVKGRPLPSPRLVSVNIHNDVSAPHVRYSLMMMQWGQFVDHDITHTPVNRGFGDSILECKDCDAKERLHPECLPIPVPEGDPFFPKINITSGKPFCLAFTRSMPGQLTLGFREQMNQITSFYDSSNVYGSDLCEMRELREFQGGRLNTTHQFHGGRDLLPLTTENAECKAKSGFCFEAGDARNSEQPVLTAIHTLFMRLHNQVADELSRLNPQWSDETLYHEARRICGAIQQHITWNEFLPRVLGWNAIKLYELSLLSEGYFHGYDEKCNPTVLNEFASAAFRFGHSLLKPTFKRMDNKYSERGPDLKLADMFFNPDKLHEPGMIDDLVRGVSTTSMETLDQFITEEVTNHLFEDKNTPYSGLDLASLNIQRGRDHGLPGYNLLKRTYDHVDDIDLFTGGLAETPLHGGLVGPTFACIIGIQFRNLRKCDRFWYESGNPLIRFTDSQLAEIRKITLSKVICDTSDEVISIQRANFDIPDPFLNPRVNCDALPGVNLELWKERITCKVNDLSIETGDARRTSPCVMCTCTKEGPLCQSLKIENCFHLAQSFSRQAILQDHVCKVQCAFAFRAFPSVKTGENRIGFS
ncbi:hypothetical protein TCAL_04392 [Tigriopus californicus]|uniref:Uncharacterized protein n=1 Tax=Tigriopus californicus TaxID=6832 RepID=A0A553N894_TIGCA|nr:hypothetical protein TCAL_04392 [Tigriopus californicus]|eukprot:TCALIF_04392-PA protein Name:"Similar to Pxt Chorion peroxidase (Drosophila melanogaster)" AED:0.06 eAED:0.06 QI:1/0.6/0.33/1/0.2/0.5/6/185/1535